MTIMKQLKISKLFKRAGKLPEDCAELQEEIERLELQAKEKQDEMFQLQRNSYRNKASPLKKKAESFVRPEKIVLTNAVGSLKKHMELMSVVSGTEVQSYVLGDHCCIVYLMQQANEFQVKHGLRIELKNGVNEVSKSSLPLGFNLDAVMADYDNNIMTPECLGAIRQALVAYYYRLEQFEALKKMLNVEAELFKILDGSHIEVSFDAQNDMDKDGKTFDMVLMLDYKVYDIWPDHFSFKGTDLPEGAVDVLRVQCSPFKRKPLHKAFRKSFLDDAGPYRLVEKVGTRPAEPRTRHRRARPTRRDFNNDDTFLPEDCSEYSDADVE